jgi:hypothetical protein
VLVIDKLGKFVYTRICREFQEIGSYLLEQQSKQRTGKLTGEKSPGVIGPEQRSKHFQGYDVSKVNRGLFSDEEASTSELEKLS